MRSYKETIAPQEHPLQLSVETTSLSELKITPKTRGEVMLCRKSFYQSRIFYILASNRDMNCLIKVVVHSTRADVMSPQGFRGSSKLYIKQRNISQ